MTIQTDKGETVSVEEFLEASSSVGFEKSRRPLVLGLVIGMLLLVLLVGIVVFLQV